MKVWEYELDINNYILGWKEDDDERRPDLIGTPEPLPDMNTTKHDSLKRIYKNNKIYKLVDNVIVEEDYIDNGIISFRNKYSQEQVNRLLVLGIENKSNAEYKAYRDDLLAVMP